MASVYASAGVEMRAVNELNNLKIDARKMVNSAVSSRYTKERDALSDQADKTDYKAESMYFKNKDLQIKNTFGTVGIWVDLAIAMVNLGNSIGADSDRVASGLPSQLSGTDIFNAVAGAVANTVAGFFELWANEEDLKTSERQQKVLKEDAREDAKAAKALDLTRRA